VPGGPYRSDGAGARLVVEPATRHLPGEVDGLSVDHGRLILAAEGLYFVSGWQSVRDTAGSGLLGVLMFLSIGDAPTQAADPRMIAEGRRHLAELGGLPPEVQVERSADSLHLPVDDIAGATLGRLIGPLTVVTALHGERHVFEVPRARRPAVRAWVAALPRR
jgi:hypothetical protein